MKKPGSTNKSRSKRAGLIFPVGRVHKTLKNGNYAPRISVGSSIYLAAVLEYLSAELIELSARAAVDNEKHRIIPRFMMLAVQKDEELARMMSGTTFTKSGVLPSILPQLLPKKTEKRKH